MSKIKGLLKKIYSVVFFKIWISPLEGCLVFQLPPCRLLWEGWTQVWIRNSEAIQETFCTRIFAVAL